MLTEKQVRTMLVLRHREKGNNLFSILPEEVIDYIGQVNQDPNSDIAIALRHAAYARQENVDALIAMLEKNPRLLLEAGNVITPGGLDVRRVTIYEFLLGAGDPELAKKVEPYFEKILNNKNEPIGENERKYQYERYRLHIESMLTQKPDGCDLFLMSADETNTFKISDKNHLYLYKDDDGKIFYYIEGAEERQLLEDDLIKETLKKSNFNQPAKNPVKCENKEICSVVLYATSSRDHTLPYDLISWLFDIIKKSSPEEVAAELATGDKYDKNYKSSLRDAFNKFREAKLDPKVRVARV